MAEIRSVTKADIKRYEKLMPFIMNELSMLDGFFLMCDDNFLYLDDGVGILLSLDENGEVIAKDFLFDENYQIYNCDIGEYEYHKENDTAMFTNKNTGIIDVLQADMYPNGRRDADGFDSFALYNQYDIKKDRSFTVKYQNIMGADNKLYPITFRRKPFYFQIRNHSSLKDLFHIKGNGKVYAKVNADAGGSHYFHITVNEFGLIKTLMNGAYELQEERTITRYFRKMFSIGDNIITACPYGTCYTFENMKNYIESLGFRMEPPSFLLDYYNGVIPPELEYYMDIIDSIQKKYPNGVNDDGIRFGFSNQQSVDKGLR